MFVGYLFGQVWRSCGQILIQQTRTKSLMTEYHYNIGLQDFNNWDKYDSAVPEKEKSKKGTKTVM